MPTAPSIRLTYFDSPGRAESVRVALRLAGVPFEDRRWSFGQFMEAKAAGTLPLGQVPVLEVDGVAYTQTGAMLRFVAHLAGHDLYPSGDPVAALAVDSVLDSFNDTLSTALLPSLFERDPERKLQMRQAFVEGTMTTVFRYVEGVLERSGGPFVTGQALTIADIVVALQLSTIARGVLDGIAPQTLDAWPRLSALLAAYQAHPQVQALATA